MAGSCSVTSASISGRTPEMPNINSKEHLFIIVMGKNGPEKREVKQRSSTHKLTDRIMSNYDLAIRKSNMNKSQKLI